MPPANLQGVLRLVDAGQYEQARAQVMRVLQRNPTDGDLNNTCAIILTKLGAHSQALYYAQRAAASGTNAVFFETLAHTLANNHRFAEGAAAYRRAIALHPTEPLFYLGISGMLWDSGDFRGAVDACREAARLRPDDPAPAAMLIAALQHVGEIDEALSLGRSMLSRHPTDPNLLQATLTTLNYSDDADPAEILDLARRAGSILEGLVTRPPPRAERPTHGRKLRVGYISPDLRQHSVTYFVEPILEHHDRDHFDIFAYFTASPPDATTERLKALPLTWRDMPSGTSAELAHRIAADSLDILVELSGHTTGNRLGVMAFRPARFQATYAGYPATTGLSSMDLRIVDDITDPPGSERWMSERPVRLPGCFLCYRPDARSLDVRAPRPGPVVFGSFNSGAKLSPRTIDLWTRVIKASPGSRLVLKCRQFSCPWVRSRFAERFSAAGLGPEHLDLLEPVHDKAGHLDAYAGIDIALDPLPYNGTTTTCEALWMGVPVVTLEAGLHAGRVGSSLLRAAGLDNLIARSEDEYERIATSLAADRPRLDNLRLTLRARVQASPLCDGPAFTRRLESAYRDVRNA